MMLKPNKYTDISLSVIGLSAEILQQLKSDQSQTYNQLFGHVSSKLGDGAKENFLKALVFLFSLGKVKYYQNKDVIELVT